MAHQQPRPRLEPDQLSALWQACDSKDTAPLAQLIEKLDPSAHDLRTGLTFAIERNHLNMVRYLLERGVPVDGYVVRVALQARSIPVLEMLREFGWDVNMKLGEIALTALSYAIRDPTLVSYLLKLGANPNLGPGIGPGIGDVRRRRLIPNSGSILQSAAKYSNVETLDLLIAHGAVLSNAAALHAAVEGGSVDMMARVLELGADVNEWDSLTTMGYESYGTPLLRAIVKGKTDAVRFLLEKGASTTTRGHKGETAMEMVKGDWVADEIRKMVEEVAVGEREGTGMEKEREVEERDGKGTEKEREVEERDGKGTEKERGVEEREVVVVDL